MALAITISTSTTQDQLAHPRTMVTIKEGTPYTVPVGKIFVLTAVGLTSVPSGTVVPASFLIDAVSVLRAGIVGAATATVQAGSRFYSQVCSVAPVPMGITAAAGAVLTVSDGAASSLGRAYGYLSDD